MDESFSFLEASPDARIAFIEARLTKVLAPQSVAVRDDSAQHAGHAGAAAGGMITFGLRIAAGLRAVAFLAGAPALAADLRTAGFNEARSLR